MGPEEVSEALKVRPFQPFRLHPTDGAAFDVRHPEAILPTRRVVVLGVGGDPASGVFDRAIQISLLHIVRIEPLEVPVKGNGQESPSG